MLVTSIFSFSHKVSKFFYFRVVKSQDFVVKGYSIKTAKKPSFSSFSVSKLILGFPPKSGLFLQICYHPHLFSFFNGAVTLSFYAPASIDRGHIVFDLSVCLFLCLQKLQHWKYLLIW